MADQRKVFSDHRDKVTEWLEDLAESSETTTDERRYTLLAKRVKEVADGRGPDLNYETVMETLESLDDALNSGMDEYKAAHDAVVDLADAMQPQALRPYHDVIYEALDVPIDSADTPEERAQATRIRDRIGAAKLLNTGELKYLQEQLERGEDVYAEHLRRHRFQSARIRASLAADVARHEEDTGRPADLQTINLHRRAIGQPPLDPVAAGWSAEDVELEARRIAALPNPGAYEKLNPGAYEKLKRSLMR